MLELTHVDGAEELCSQEPEHFHTSCSKSLPESPLHGATAVQPSRMAVTITKRLARNESCKADETSRSKASTTQFPWDVAIVALFPKSVLYRRTAQIILTGRLSLQKPVLCIIQAISL